MEQEPRIAPHSQEMGYRQVSVEKLNVPEHEKNPVRTETREVTGPGILDDGVASAQPLQLPAPVATSQTANNQQTKGTKTPVAAADQNLIEKSWVEVAKKIVADTKGDPYSREDKVSKLQRDYRSKRLNSNYLNTKINNGE